MPRVCQRKQRPVGPMGDPQELPRTVWDYLEWLRTTNFSERTVENRLTYLGDFVSWCQERSLSRPDQITRPILERYQRHLYHYRQQNGAPLSFRSQFARLSALRMFFRWAARQHRILYNPASELEMPKLEKRLPKAVLSVSEAELVLQQPDLADPLGLRDRAILEVLYSTGLRRSELIGLSLYDLDWERGTLMVRQGKGKKDRMLPIGERAVAWTRRYLDDVRPQLLVDPEDPTIFLTREGEPLSAYRLSQLVRDYVDAAELGKRGSCHLFRHTMATLMLEGGADILYIQQMLGHANLATTQLYTQVSILRLKQVHALTHPGARLQRQPDRDPVDAPVLVVSSAAENDAELAAQAGAATA